MLSSLAKPTEPAVLSLEVLARDAASEVEEQPTQFRVLVRHFLECFFRNEVVSSEVDAKTRLVQAACAIGVPGLVIALYLYTPYHMPHQVRPYWAQVGDHYFYVLYSLVAMALVVIFEWDLFFPGLLDTFVLSPLPVRGGRVLRARVTAIFIVIGAALFDANFLAPLVLPAATDPPDLPRFLAAHMIAVAAAGLFAAAFFLALEGILLGLLGDRFFSRISLWLQGLSVFALLTLLFLYPVICGALRGILQSGSDAVLWIPPFWFLGLYQRVLDGPATVPVFARLAHVAWAGTLAAMLLAVAAYPLAWWRKTRGLVESGAKRDRHHRVAQLVHRVLHASLARSPAARAVWHFVGSNLLRVPRYRMYLVLYGGMGAALAVATIFRARTTGSHLVFLLSPGGFRASIPIVAFWTVSGLRTTFLSPSDQRGRWIFRVICGKAGADHLLAAQRWVLLWSVLLSCAVILVECAAAPAAFHGWRALVTQALVAVGASLLLTDAFFVKVTTIPFAGKQSASTTNFALLLIPYLGFFPAVVLFTVAGEPWIEGSTAHLLAAVIVVIAAHCGMRMIHRNSVAEHAQQIEADEDQEDFPLRLGLRY